MPNIVQPFNNFARGKIDHDLQGRFDLQIYQTGSDVFHNFISNFKGNGIFRSGWKNILGAAFQDCALIEFKFGVNQNYLCVFFANGGTTKVRFLSYASNGAFGWVLDAGLAILEVASPYSLAAAKRISKYGSFTQRDDVMYLAHPSYAPYKLTRVSATSFTLATYSRTADPFTGAGDWPGAVTFYKSALYWGRTNNKITTFWKSKDGDYDNYTTGSNAADAIIGTLADLSTEILWIFPASNSLIFGAADGIVALNGGGVNTAITPSTFQATLTTAPGAGPVYPLAKNNLMFYIEFTLRRMYYFSYNILSESFEATDANETAYDITVGGISKIRWKKDRNDLIYGLRDGTYTTTNFRLTQNEVINGWHDHETEGTLGDIAVIVDNDGNPQIFAVIQRGSDYFIENQADFVEFSRRPAFYTGSDEESADTVAYIRKVAEELKGCVFVDGAQEASNLQSNSITYAGSTTPGALGTITATTPVFSSGDVGKQISYKTMTGYEFGRYEITAYTDTTHVDVEVLQEPTAVTYSDWYLTFSTLSGLAFPDGTEVAAVCDGGYLADFTVQSGAIDLDKQVTKAVIGYKYRGLIKSFALGLQANAENTQITMKTFNEFFVRCVDSAGGRIGTSMYDLQTIQKMGTGNDQNGLPPLPIDGTSQPIPFVDKPEVDKCFYLVQDEPLPFTVCAAFPGTHHVVRPGASG